MARRAQRAAARRADASAPVMTDEAALKAARSAGKERIAQSGVTRALLGALSAAMKLDLILFGHVESGPFFALLERTPHLHPPASAKATADKPTSDLRPPISDLQQS
jgi:hypothetical protein